MQEAWQSILKPALDQGYVGRHDGQARLCEHAPVKSAPPRLRQPLERVEAVEMDLGCVQCNVVDGAARGHPKFEKEAVRSGKLQCLREQRQIAVERGACQKMRLVVVCAVESGLEAGDFQEVVAVASGLAKVHASRWGRRRVLRDNRNAGFRWWPALRQERKRAGDLRAQAILRLKLLQLRNALVARTRDALDEGFNDVKNLRDLRLLKGSQGAYDGKQVGS